MTLRGVICLRAGEPVLVASRRLPLDGAVPLGRGMSWGLPKDRGWVPRRLAVLTPIEPGWLVENGTASLTVSGPAIKRAEFHPDGVHVLTHGTWFLSWSLDEPLDAEVRLLSRLDGASGALPLADSDPLPESGLGTLRAGRQEQLTPTQIRRMAELFRHLLLDEPPPDNLCATAASRVRMTENRLRVYANQVRDTVNRDRARPLRTLDDLGHYLVFDTRAVTRADLGR